MLVRTDPFRDFDRLARQIWGTTAHPAGMPMDAWRDGEQIVVQFDLPGVDPDAVELDVERNVLTVRAERRPATGDDTEMIAAERPRGVFSRQLILGDTLDTDRVQANYTAGVLTLRIPVAERAKPRKITVSNTAADRGELPG
jgi:Molecular chaperone (small heat shock protein)